MAWYDSIVDGVFRFTNKDAEKTNYKYELFDKLAQDVNVDDWSAVAKYFKEIEKDDMNMIGDTVDKGMKNFMYGSVSTNKVVRLSSYRRMADFPEVGDAIDEICDSSITNDENGNLVTLTLPAKYGDLDRKEIENSWSEYVNLFDFENRMFEYMRSFAIDGELAWEHIVSKDKPEVGILDIKFLPTESYEFTYDLSNNQRVGLTVYLNDGDINMNAHQSEQKNKASNYSVGNINIQTLNTFDALSEKRAVFLPWEQTTYINTGLYNSIGSFVYPVLERARRAYNQLAMIEDAIIIYRLVRAPERLVFNVDVGNATRNKAEQEVLKMMKKYNTKKVYNPTTGSVANDYDPHSMIESFWFVKTQGGGGTDVTTLGGGQNLGELEDLNYFLRKLYLSLKVPYNRYADPTVSIEKTTSINYEEYRFAKFIMRLHNRFALGLKDGFKTHLKLKGIWEKQSMKDLDIKIRFTPPSSFDRYEEQQRMTIIIDQYTALADREEFSNTFCMERYLGWSKDEIAENWKRLKEDAIKQGLINYAANNAEESGNPKGLNDEEEEDW
jgi:hypothetical protein